MYAGHFAAGLALKARTPEAPTWGLLTGVALLDILFGPFVLAGIERVSVTPTVSPGFSLDYIDWSHSLMMSIVCPPSSRSCSCAEAALWPALSRSRCSRISHWIW